MHKRWQHSTELDQEKAGSWLHTVARNICHLRLHRRRRNRPREVPLDENALRRPETAGPDVRRGGLLGTARNSLTPAPGPLITELFFTARPWRGGGDARIPAGTRCVALPLGVRALTRGA